LNEGSDIEKKKFLLSQLFKKSFFLLSAIAYRVHIKTFPAKKSFPNAKRVFKKVSSSFASFDPFDVEGAAFHTFDSKTFGGVTE
jgi:hypothetical protein